jgi:tetrahydromethanopterin S-methyltransferase subunit F
MSEKLEKMIEMVRSKQKRSIDDYERIKDSIRIKANFISEANQNYINSVSVQAE